MDVGLLDMYFDELLPGEQPSPLLARALASLDSMFATANQALEDEDYIALLEAVQKVAHEEWT